MMPGSRCQPQPARLGGRPWDGNLTGFKWSTAVAAGRRASAVSSGIPAKYGLDDGLSGSSLPMPPGSGCRG